MPFKHILLAILVTAIWGVNFIFAKLGVKEIPPLFLCTIRFMLVCVPAIFFVKFPKTSVKLIVAYGLFMFTLQFALVFISLSVGMTAGIASLLMQSQLFFSTIFAFFIFGERPSQWEIVGGLIALSGIVMVGMHAEKSVTAIGSLFVVLGACSWAIGNLIIKKIGKVNMPSLIVWGSLVACLPLLILSLILEGHDKILSSINNWSWIGLISLLYIVYASTWIGYSIWSGLISRYSITAIVPFTLLIPIFGIVSSVIFLGESFTFWKAVGSCLVIGGLSLNILGPRWLTRNKLAIERIS